MEKSLKSNILIIDDEKTIHDSLHLILDDDCLLDVLAMYEKPFKDIFEFKEKINLLLTKYPNSTLILYTTL